ncbi:glycosyltransferase family 2 protein [Nocardioides sp.]|uniref:glycosyltransferase family 2 protein n=1 Tax=Nocardioides sp. TaxID=35761 RepID=UPI0027284A4C|nr:glycosyltransferase family 2 protein [Nocardioides sp.]MDO9458296.1 glycosyltransferase family 2 protein [Nocardioides sp.]
MIVAVSTIKDTAPNVRRYVSRNLANGVDHLVVFTEDTGAEAEAVLDEHHAVTHVRTGGDWWPERPGDLNVRQRANANLARVLLAPFAWAEWLVHIDGDEVAVIDRDVVAAFPPERATFRMVPLEAVSRDAWPDGEITHFKRLLERPELVLLTVLGLVEKPDNKAYFHGHVRGKVGVRLRTDHRIGLHIVRNRRGRGVETVKADGLAVLHYDSATADDFVRKFMTLAGSGSRAVYRTSRIPTVNALRTLSTMDVSDEVRARYLRRVYDLTTREDFETLHDLGLLDEVHADAGTHVPEAVPAADLAAFEALLAAAAPLPRDSLSLDHPEGGYDVLRAALAATGHPAGAATEVLDRIAGKLAAAQAAADAASDETAAPDETGPQPGRRRGIRVPRWRA